MEHYLLSIYQPDGEGLSPQALAPIMKNVHDVDAEMRQAGVWVFAGGLHSADNASVVKPGDVEMPITDGPYVEGKEHIGGITVIRVAGREEANAWARKLSNATTLPIEVRPFAGVAEA